MCGNGIPDVLLQFGGGIGDELLLTTVARELKRRNRALRIWQVSRAWHLLKGNPDYHRVFDMNHWPLRYTKMLTSRRLQLHYAIEKIPIEAEVPPADHVLAILCRGAGLSGQIALRPYLNLTDTERAGGRRARRQIAIQCAGSDANQVIARNKLWPPERFQTVVQQIQTRWPDCTIIQIGGNADPALPGTIDLRGKTSLRETAAVLSHSMCFIGTEGFLMHLARAVDCRSVIVFGGRVHSWQTGYACNENLDSFVPCAPCWLWNACDFDRFCMTNIKPDHVVAAVDRAIDKFGTPLATDTVELDAPPVSAPRPDTSLATSA